MGIRYFCFFAGENKVRIGPHHGNLHRGSRDYAGLIYNALMNLEKSN